MKFNGHKGKFTFLTLLVLTLALLIPAIVLADATISGNVTDTSAMAIENMHVHAYVTQGWGEYIGGDTTDASGNYTITIADVDIPGSGEIYVWAWQGESHQNYKEEWYDESNGTTDQYQAAAVTISDGNDTPNIDFELEEGQITIEWFDMYTSGGNLESAFAVMPGYHDLVESAVVTGPGGLSEAYDIVNGKFSWLNECRFLIAYYDTYQPGSLSDGEYTLTVTFVGGRQETTTAQFSAAGTITPVDDTTLSHTVNPDGSIQFNWTPPDTTTQKYRIQIYSVSDGDRYYQSGWMQTETTYTIDPYDLRCLVKGQAYRWYVRARNAAGNGWENGTSMEFVYNPSSLDHQVSAGVDEWKGFLEIWFNTRPGSRNTSTVTSASVAGPNGFAYTFDLASDWYDLSTAARLSYKGWYHMDATWPIAGGDYTFTIQFSDSSTVTQTSTFTPAAVAGVDADDMGAEIYADGAINFEWETPDGVSNQYYQVRIRSLDGSKEYFKSDSLFDEDGIEAYIWDLKALVPGQTYQWFVRAWDNTWLNMRQSETLYFYYAPFESTGTVSGTVSITGTSGGGFAIGAFPRELGWEWWDCQAVGVVESTDGIYTLTLPAGDWYIVSVQDADESGEHDDGEPVGWYTATVDPMDLFGLPAMVPLTVGQTVSGIDFTIYADADEDGVQSVIEQGPLGTDTAYNGNEDQDAIADCLQDNVVSFPTYDKEDYVTLSVPDTITLEDVMSIDNPSPTDAPADKNFPQGFFVFTIDGLTAGGATTVTLYLPAGEAPETYYKYGPTPDYPVDHWYEFMYDDTTKTGAVINGNVITLHFVDGKRGDDDLTANGTIEDIGGPAKAVTPPPDNGGTGSTSGGGGGGGGCFMSTMTQ